MEEDIKKCEALLGSERWVLGTQDKKALENLIKGYKLEKLKNVLDEQSLKESLEDYIPKSKIREMLEELKEIKRVQENNPFTSPVYIKELEYGIQILEELLEGE